MDLHVDTLAHRQSPGTADPAPPPTPVEAILRRVRTLAERRILWLQTMAECTASTPAHRDLPAALRTALLDADAPEREARFLAEDHRAQHLTAREAEHTRTLQDDQNGLFAHLVDAFELTDAESDLLQVCVAAAVDPGMVEICGYLAQGRVRRYPTDALAARLCGHGRTSIWDAGSPLARWQLLVAEEVEPGEPPALRVDPAILSYLQGRATLDPDILPVAEIVRPLSPLPNWPVESIARQVHTVLEQGMPARIHMVGPRLSGRRTFAALVADALGAPLIAVDADRAGSDVSAGPWAQIRLRVDRQALLYQCAVAWYRLADEQGLDPRPHRLPLEFVIAEPPADPSFRPGRWELRVELPRLTVGDRDALWGRFVPTAHVWPDGERSRLAERHALEIGEIAHIGSQDARTFEDIQRLCREANRGRLGDLGTLLDCPFRRQDLHVPQRLGQVLDEFLFEARERVRFWEADEPRRLFPRGTGLTALMSGPPGTGKTMAAQVVAAELGLDLYRIDLAATVDKYIGETSKNLRRIFARASSINAVLLFDEADALFSKRTDIRDAHDRHANADTNYLLQLVEDYPGIVLLATNKRQNMDEAFVRRLRYLMYFPRPEAAQRTAIWRELVAALAGPERAGQIGAELQALGQLVETSGAEIKNAVLAAAFLARQDGRPLGAAHLYRGLERELGNQGRDVPIRLDHLERRSS